MPSPCPLIGEPWGQDWVPTSQDPPSVNGEGLRQSGHWWWLTNWICFLWITGCAQSFPTLWTHWGAHARLLCPWGFSRQEYWSGLLCPPPGDLPNPGIEPRSPTLQVDSLPTKPPRKPRLVEYIQKGFGETSTPAFMSRQGSCSPERGRDPQSSHSKLEPNSLAFPCPCLTLTPPAKVPPWGDRETFLLSANFFFLHPTAAPYSCPHSSVEPLWATQGRTHVPLQGLSHLVIIQTLSFVS